MLFEPLSIYSQDANTLLAMLRRMMSKTLLPAFFKDGRDPSLPRDAFTPAFPSTFLF